MAKSLFYKSTLHCTFKASIIGCGSVGATTAYAYLLSGNVTDLMLIDIDKSRAEGLMLDLEHALPFTPHTEIEAMDDFEACNGSNIIIVTAGKRQKEGETRLDLVSANKKIFTEIIPKIAKAAPNSILVIVSNPVDILTYQALQSSGFPKEKVFGSGTILDTARLKFHVSERIGAHPESVSAYILGEHGDTSFPVYSSANIAGKPLFDFENFSEKVGKECYEEAKNAAYRIINDQGYTCYSIATAIREITEAIFADEKRVFPLSVVLDDYYGYSDICLSVPCILGKDGIEKVIHVPLNEEEQNMLGKSVETLKGFL